MRVLVTGATGFVGSHLVTALLAADREVTCLVRATSNASILEAPDLRLVIGDITDKVALRTAIEGVQAVVHLAAVGGPDMETCQRVNVEGVRTVSEACQELGVRRVIAASTVSSTREHLGAYGLTKRQGDRLWQASGLDVTVLRFSLVYGQDERSAFGRMVQLVTAFPFVPVVGPGTYEVQPVHVDDVCQAILRCLETPATAGRTYVLAGREPTTFNQLVDLILAEEGQHKPKLHIPVPLALLIARAMALVIRNPPLTVDNILGMNQPTDYDIAAAEQDFGFEPRPLREGLKEALEGPSDPEAQRIAVVGLGRMGLLHAALLKTIPKVRLVGLCDRQARLGKQARGMRLRAPFYTEFEQMLDDRQPHGVFICTPPSSHLALARACMQRGIGVFLEKPLAESLEAGRQVVALLDSNPVAHAVGFQSIHFPVFREARDLLRSGVPGRPLRVQASMYLSQVLGRKKASWWYEPAAAGGGVVIGVASHLLMLLYQYFGPIRWAEAQTRRIHSRLVEDEATIHLGFANGVEATVDTSWSTPGYEQAAISIIVEGEEGTLSVSEGAIHLNLNRPVNELPAGEHHIVASEIPDPAAFELGGPGLWAEDAEFVACLADGNRSSVSLHDALAVQQVVDAIYCSARDARRVELDGRSGQDHPERR